MKNIFIFLKVHFYFHRHIWIHFFLCIIFYCDYGLIFLYYWKLLIVTNFFMFFFLDFDQWSSSQLFSSIYQLCMLLYNRDCRRQFTKDHKFWIAPFVSFLFSFQNASRFSRFEYSNILILLWKLQGHKSGLIGWFIPSAELRYYGLNNSF